MTFTNGTPFQHAIAGALQLDDRYFTELAGAYRDRRDKLATGLADIGFDVFGSAGSYFVTVDIRSVGYDDDVAFCLELPARAGVVAVPCSAFHADPRRGNHLVRFAFCKTDEALDEALRRLRDVRWPTG
jgi:N-succinyldiaminopimelate aminotransferase